MSNRVGFSFGPGALGMLIQAKKDETNEEHTVHLDGDLCSMSAQYKFLISCGVDVKFNNVYPCVKPCDEEQTFKLLWSHKCDGWWLYQKKYEKFNICDKEEFMKTLNKWCDEKDC